MTFELIITRKKVKNITIKIKSPQLVEVVAPNSVSYARIQELLKLKSKWIEDKLKQSHHDNKINFKDGELVPFLGENYKLVLFENDKKEITLKDDKIIINAPLLEQEKLLNQWYKSQAKVVFTKILSDFLLVVKKDVKSLKIRTMKTRWGSCNSTKAYINLNTELIKKPTKAIEAVIMHELIHLYHPNHSKDFYSTLLDFMPDYYERIGLLKNLNI